MDHRRLRGEHPQVGYALQLIQGSPPPARGARRAARCRCRQLRITPACAGSTGSTGARSGTSRDHPRLRGEHRCGGASWTWFSGSPPPARAAPTSSTSTSKCPGITPACAGSTRQALRRARAVSDHPRLRGEHTSARIVVAPYWGSPPPARGARRRARRSCRVLGITPACAGSTTRVQRSCAMHSDHPRLRGEHATGATMSTTVTGSPPPARGARCRSVTGHVVVGITPACAGSAEPHTCRFVPDADHPRLRGEHAISLGRVARSPGSPPPARGARGDHGRSRFCPRITPACAGSTCAAWERGLGVWDHPRLRGEHWPLPADVADALGSPPPARGARHAHGWGALAPRITPACAGSTLVAGRLAGSPRDHPRLRGEHTVTDDAEQVRSGSPPPARGAHPDHLDDRLCQRITPACAGSTTMAYTGHAFTGDHPRLRGEHLPTSSRISSSSGSPPPARGAPPRGTGGR